MTTTLILWFLTLVFLSNAPSNTLQQELGSVMRWCYDSAGNYTPNTPYQANLLTTLLPSLASNAPLNTTGYYSTDVGRDTDRVFGFAQCMSAASMQDCRTCLNQSIAAIVQLCPRRKQAFIRYENCVLRYSNQSIVTDGLYPAEGLMAPPPPPPSAEQGNGSKSRRDIIIGVVVAILIIVILFICRVARKKTVNGVLVEPNSETIDESKPMLFDLNEIRAATDNFSKANELGQGGFGAVYKGTLADGQQIAVKRLRASSNQGIPELKNEVALLAKLQHRNLVRLLGCSLENQENLLIYEFVRNSSLEKFVFGSSSSPCTSVYNNSTYGPFNYLRSLMIQIQLNGVSLNGIFGSKSLKELLEVCYISTKILGSGSFTGT